MICTYCRASVDPRYAWRRVVGWEQKAVATSRRRGSDIVLRQQLDEYACNGCVTRLKSGIALGQGTLA